MSVLLFLLALLALSGGVCALVTVVRSNLSLPVFLFGWLNSEHPWHFVAFEVLLVLLWTEAALAIDLTLPLFIAAWLCRAMAWERSTRAPGELLAALQRDLPEAAAGLDIRVQPQDLLLPIRRPPPAVTVTPDVAYSPPQPGDKGGRNLLNIIQRTGTGPRRQGEPGAPVLLQVHGGGWMVGDKREQGLPLLYHMAAKGWICFSINYRLSPQAQWPDQIVDVKRALAWVRRHAAEYGGNPDFICITGGSAGGHLSALAALSQNDPAFQPGFEDADTRLAAAVPFYGAVDPLNDTGGPGAGLTSFLAERVFKTRFPLSAEAQEQFAAASPYRRISAAAPPMFLLQGDKDCLVPVDTQRRFAEALREASEQPVVYAELHGAEHAFDITWGLRALAARQAVAAFLDTVHRRFVAGELGPDGTRPD